MILTAVIGRFVYSRYNGVWLYVSADHVMHSFIRGVENM